MRSQYVLQADWKEGFKKKAVGVSDMTLLTTISNESINENLEKRWKAADIYTWIGGVLISVNPFRGAWHLCTRSFCAQ
jgi:myosin-1